ncbi:MAG: c-type cytochrome [Polaromonas sp.]|nr:c-type cytochrome [Polaromonas sp.]
MKLNPLLLAGALAAFSGGAQSQAQAMDPLQVRSMAASCASCHGTQGVAQAGNESLAGVNRDELLKKMLDFKTGKKPATIMHQLSRGYSDEQLAALAAYFSSLKK